MTKQAQFVDKVYKLTREAAPLSFMLPTRNSKRFPLLWFDEKQVSTDHFVMLKIKELLLKMNKMAMPY